MAEEGVQRSAPARETSSGGVVFRRDEAGVRFLLIRDPYRNWGLPKGHVEDGETPEQAAVREVGEETGLNALDVVAPLPTIDWFFRSEGRLVHKVCHFYLLECASGDAVPQHAEGISECVWRPFGAALAQLTYANAREVLRAAGQHLGEA